MKIELRRFGWDRGFSHFWRVSLVVCTLTGSFFQTASAEVYTEPPSQRTDVLLNSHWQFIRQDVPGAQNPGFDDSAWTPVDLPHTWNNLDGEDGGGNYYRGIGWYRKHYALDNGYAGRRVFLKFDGAFSVADIYVNGTFAGEHQGGFAAFVFDVTPYLLVGGDNVIAVKVNNAFNANVPPLSADFTFFGGLYRSVHLLATAPVQISPLDFGSPGAYLKTTGVSSNSATLQVTTVVSNSTAQPRAVTVRAVVTDALSNIVSTLTNEATLAPGAISNVTATTMIATPHLWDGRGDSYLYQTHVELWDGATVVDVVTQPLGFRWFSVDPTNGFFLNGRHYDLHGVSLHQDWLDRGWAIGSAERQTNFALLKEIGATALRLSHYQHAEETYQLADQNGIILWSEIPLINYITESSNFYANARQQMTELIRQNYNHPAVVCWGLFNEITLSPGPVATNLVSQLAQLVAQEDPTRLSTAAANSSNNDPTTRYSQLIAFNKYYGWYNGVITDFAAWADNIHATMPGRCIGVSEYGAGASIRQHSENPTPPSPGGNFHPEEYQNLFHEIQWQQMKARPFLWCKFIWTLCDFASDGRNEGDTPGRNDKGLVTYDRLVRKDAFYWYKANWTTNPMVYLTGHTFTNRMTNAIQAKVYANCDSVELILNGVSQGSQTSTNCIFTWPVALRRGTNNVTAIGAKDSLTVTDSLMWVAPVPPPTASILKPSSSVVFLNSTNDTLQLSAAASDDPNPPGPLQISWGQLSGPGMISFGDTNALATTARFSADGVYGLQFQADNGTATNDISLTVVVNPASGVRDGLLAWWKMDETGGVSAADFSGNGLTANVSGGVFAAGHESNALFLNGSNSVATFASPDSSQISIAAWVRADALGNSAYPRILETPGYRMFFRFDSQGTNGFDFATFHSTRNGDWFSGQDTIRLGAWYHIVACYDRNNPGVAPAMYVNGVRVVSPRAITTPSGTLPPFSGTGYIGNNAALSRAWSGGIDDLRIYNRILTDAEARALAAMPPRNTAPSIDTGTNKTAYLPVPFNLQGTVSDDGNPNPPGHLMTWWSVLSGPGSVSFANSNAPDTSVIFSTPGDYLLRLAGDDGEVQTSHDLVVTVVAPPVLSLVLLSGALRLSWPASTGSWMLQYQTNPLFVGLSTDWISVPGPVTNPFMVPIPSAAGCVFYRLVLTN